MCTSINTMTEVEISQFIDSYCNGFTGVSCVYRCVLYYVCVFYCLDDDLFVLVLTFTFAFAFADIGHYI